MTAAGLEHRCQACRQILFTYSVPCDQFLAICKLRAARKMWARVAEACGASEPARAMRLNTVTAWRMMSKNDPWVNMLRTTVACFAAAVGGANSITVRPFDADARNDRTNSVGASRATPTSSSARSRTWRRSSIRAGGSWYVESRTDELAKVAWAEFQEIERAGGIVAVLQDGSLAKKIADAYAQREAALAKRRDPITGVSEFPNIMEAPLQLEQPDLAGGVSRGNAIG